MREERNNLPIPIEWDRAYQAIEMMIQHTYIPLEKEQIVEAFQKGDFFSDYYDMTKDASENYYNKTYGGDQ